MRDQFLLLWHCSDNKYLSLVLAELKEALSHPSIHTTGRHSNVEVSIISIIVKIDAMSPDDTAKRQCIPAEEVRTLDGALWYATVDLMFLRGMLSEGNKKILCLRCRSVRILWSTVFKCCTFTKAVSVLLWSRKSFKNAV